MIWIARTGAQWRALPENYGSWKGIYSRFCKWRDHDVLERAFWALSSDADRENLSIASTLIYLASIAIFFK